MLLLKSWQESISIFIPKNFKLFLLVTLKSTLELYCVIGHYFWWLVVLGAIYIFSVPNSFMAINPLWSGLNLYLLSILARPSVFKKDSAYIMQHLCCYSMILLLIIPLMYLPSWLLIISLPIIMFTILFYCDTKGLLEDIPRSLLQAVNMFIYNMPFMFISVLVVLAGYLALSKFGIYSRYLSFSFVPFVVSYFKNIYVKRMHDQFNLYYTV